MTNQRQGLTRAKTLRLSPLARSTVGSVGIACLCAGTLAVFETDNRFGTLALLLLGAGQVLTAAIGQIPIRIKVGDKEVTYSDAFSYAEGTQETLAEAIAKPEVALDGRRAISDLIVSFNEQFMAQVGVLPEFGRNLAVQAYRTSVLAALRRSLPEAQVVDAPSDLEPLDFIVRARGRELHVVNGIALKTTSSHMPGEVVNAFVELAKSVQLLLVVSNKPPAEPAYERVTTRSFEPKPLPQNIEIVMWTGPDDDRALANRARTLLGVQL